MWKIYPEPWKEKSRIHRLTKDGQVQCLNKCFLWNCVTFHGRKHCDREFTLHGVCAIPAQVSWHLQLKYTPDTVDLSEVRTGRGLWDAFFSLQGHKIDIILYSFNLSLAPFSIHLFPHRAAWQSTSSMLHDTLMVFFSIQPKFIQLLLHLFCLLILCKKYYPLLRQLNWYFSTGFLFKFEHNLSGPHLPHCIEK